VEVTPAVAEAATTLATAATAAAAAAVGRPERAGAEEVTDMGGPGVALLEELDRVNWTSIMSPSRYKPLVPRKWGKSVHTAWRRVVRAALLEVEKGGERGLKLLFLLPKALLVYRARGRGDAPAKILAARLAAPWVRLAEYVEARAEPGGDDADQERPVDEQAGMDLEMEPLPSKGEASRRGKRAVALAKVGQLSRALRTLAESARPVDADAPGILEKIRELHPGPARPPERSRGPQEDEEAPTLANVETAFAKLAPLAAAGPSGWVKEMIDPRDVDRFTGLLNKLAWEDIGTEAATYIFGGLLIPLDKGGGRVRPIVVGELFPKWLSKAIQVTSAKHLGDVFAAQRQYGVSTSKGAEIVGHAARQALRNGASIFKIDFANAYNTISRALIADGLAREGSASAQRMLRHFDRRYPQEGWWPRLAVRRRGGGVDWVESRTGVQQGDPLGPALFAYGLSEVLRRVRSDAGMAEARVVDVAYLDDVAVIGDLRSTIRVAEAVERSAKDLGSGLELNWSKCEIFTPDLTAARGQVAEWPPERRPVILDQGVVVLGIPIGIGDFERSHWNNYVKEYSGPRVRVIDSLAQPNSAQIKMALLRYCAVPLAGHMLRTTHPQHTSAAAQQHDLDILDAFKRIVNTPVGEVFSPAVVAQIQRPVKLGGFGMASAAKAVEAAYIASVAATHKAVLAIPLIAEQCKTAEAGEAADSTAAFREMEVLYEDIKNTCRSSYDGGFPGGEKVEEAMRRTLDLPAKLEEFYDNEKKPQQRITRGLQLTEWLQAYTVASQEGKATMLSLTQRGALDAFTVIPFQAELALTDYIFAFGVRKALGLSTQQDVEGLQCTCGAAQGSMAQHIRNCRRGGGMIQRHDFVVRTLGEMLRVAGLQPVIDKRAHYFEAGNGGPDIGVDNYPRAGLDAFVEFSIINPTQHRCCAAAARSYLSAARDREAAKRTKYSDVGVANMRSVWGVAMETTGAFGPGLQAFIKTVVALDQIALTPEEAPWLSTSPRAYWSQRISVAFHRASYWMAERVASAAARNALSSR
jgi:hypothetical protein